MPNLNTRIIPPTTTTPALLLARGIRRADLLQIGRVPAAGDEQATRLLDALEDLGSIADNAYEGELDAAVGDIETLANLGQAVCDLTSGDLGQLEFEAAKARTPGGTVTALLRQQPTVGAA